MSTRLLALAAVLLLGSAAAAGAETPTLTARPGAAGVVVTWTLPSGHTSTNLHWSTNPATVPTPASDPSEGLQMACFASGPSDGIHNCTGGTDLGDTQTSYTIKGLKPGTYYVQVMTYGIKKWLDTNYNVWLDVHYYGYSQAVPFTVTAQSSGGSTGAPTKPSGGTQATASVTVSGSGPVTVWRRNGATPQVTQVKAGPVTLGPDERIVSGARALKLAIKEGRVVIAPHTQIGFLRPGEWEVWGAPKGELSFYAGEAWFSVPKAPTQHRLLVDVGGGTIVRTIGPATFAVKEVSEARAEQVQVLAGKAEVARSRSDKKPVLLTANFQLFHPFQAPLGKPTKLKLPTKPFWK
jgi:hypothetical protein